MQKPSKLAQIPQIRFAGFTEDWERRKFGELAVRESNCDISSIDMPCVEYEDVIANEGQLNKDISLKEMQKKGIIFDGSQVLFGKLRPYLHNWLNPDFKGVAVGDWWVLRPIKLDKNFLYRLIQTQQFDDIANQSAGSKMPRADWNLIAETEFIVPSLIEEQNKIGELFANLDNLITLHQRKVEKLQKIKKSCLQNLFPQNNQNTPKIRFKNFSDEWEVRKLGEIANYRRGSFPQPYGKSEWYDGEEAKPFIQVADITDSMNLVSDTKQKISKLAQPMSVFAEKGSVLVTLQGSIGRVAITQYGAFVDRTVLIFEKYKIDIDNLFWAHIIKQKFIKEARKAPGGTIKTITKEALSDFDLLLSNYNEQQKIGAFFSKLDKLISLQQRKVEKLKNIKKALLNNMFI